MELTKDIKPFLQPCMRLLHNPQAVQTMQILLESVIFENKGTRVIVPLDPVEGKCYTEPIPKGGEHIYKLTA